MLKISPNFKWWHFYGQPFLDAADTQYVQCDDNNDKNHHNNAKSLICHPLVIVLDKGGVPVPLISGNEAFSQTKPQPGLYVHEVLAEVLFGWVPHSC